MTRGVNAICSMCGGADLSQKQRSKPRDVRRCTSCVLNDCQSICSTSSSSHGDDIDLPNCISIDVIGDVGVVQQTQTEFGRSARLAHDSNYSIRISNDLRKHSGGKSVREKIAAVVRVDGKKVSPNPILIGKSRQIDGFTLARKTFEICAPDKTSHVYEIKETVARFQTRSSRGSSRGGRKIDNKVGTIEFEFFRLKMTNIQPGTRTRKQRKQSELLHLSQGRAREGLLSTSFGEKTAKTGHHCAGGNRKPVADYNKPLGGGKIFLCDQRVATLGDYVG